jgi:predicted  nucleic acid-binding Zn-ribbon protein
MPERPYGRREFNRALILNALLTPFNVVLLALMLIAGIVLGVLPFVLPVAVALYGVAAARTYLDEDVAAKVLERERAQQRAALESGRKRLEPEHLASPIRKLVQEARFREARIADAIERAELPFAEVATEVDGFVTAMDRTAQRAQLLHEALEDTPTSRVRARLDRTRSDPAQAELAAALETQLHTLERMEGQLRRFFGEMERMLVELDTVRSQLVSVSASTETAHQTELAGEVRALRERMGTVAEGMAAAYEGP